jgi:hypothetical protein
VADGKPVFLGIGRAKDVEAYLGKVSRLEVVGHDAQGHLVTEQPSGDASLPDPAGVDVWTVSTRTQNSASLVWPDTPGQWRLVAATDGESGGPTRSTSPGPPSALVVRAGADRGRHPAAGRRRA